MSNEEKLREYLKRAMAETRRTQQLLQEAEEREREPIAIVGMSCRLPGGVASPAQFWRLLTEGREGMGPLPEDRGWRPEELFGAQTEQNRWPDGAFVADAAGFDAEFFGISPREALAMDPQQRLLLEASWEALEDAGLEAESLRGSLTGSFIGTNGRDYASQLREAPAESEGYLMTGNALSVLSGRLSYVYGFVGPALSVDTACSSSLVALHLACHSLRHEECTLALAGGVTVMSTPFMYAEFTKQGGLATDGRCKAYADAADGTGWGEGVGVLVLERLSDARRLGHHVLGVIRGSAVNQDGASNGLTAPNGPSQERVILQALANSGIGAADVDLVEGHGTGTRLGDPIEAQALLATYGQGRTAGPVRLGSVKSNIGHTQAAAGVAGVIKAVLALRHELMPQTLHVDEPSGQVDWSAGAVELLTEAREWSREDGRPRRAGVSSFGISGTNAHVIVEEGDAPAEAVAVSVPSGGVVWPLSAKSEGALRAQAGRLAEWAAEADEGLVETGLALAGRSRFGHRAAAVGADRESLVAQLREIAVGGGSTGSGTAAVLFSGQGSQRVGMGLGLRGVLPVFTEVFDEVCGLLGLSLDAFEDADALNRTEVTQPALFAVQVAAYRQLEAWGLSAAWLGGHSIGELTAAYLAGVWDLEGACKIVAARGRLMGQARSGGAMAALEATEAQVLADLTAGIGIAAVNGPTSIVVSGDAESVDALVEQYKNEGRRARRLVVSHAFHSHHMDEVLGEFEEIVASVPASTPRLKLVSTLTGTELTDEATQASYWVRQVREAVRFADAVSFLTEQGTSVYLDISPDGVLTSMVTNVVDGATVIPTLRKDIDEPTALTHTAAALHTAGQQIDWPSLLGGGGTASAAEVELPTYAFEHTRYWLDTPADGTGVGDVRAAGLDTAGHPLLGAALTLAGGGRIFTGRLSLAAQPWLADHVAAGAVVLPEAVLVELVVRGADEAGCGVISTLRFTGPVVLPAEGSLLIQVTVGEPAADGACELGVFSRLDDDGGEAEWTRHAVGSAAPSTPETSHAALPSAPGLAGPAQNAQPVTADTLYSRAAERGLVYGPEFRVLKRVWRGEDAADLFAELELPPGSEAAESDAASFALHPALLDGLVQALATGEGPGRAYAASEITGLRLLAAGARSIRVHLHLEDSSSAATPTARVTAVDEQGGPVLTIDTLACRELDAAEIGRLDQGRDPLRDALFALDWITVGPAVAANGGAAGRAWTLLGEDRFGIGAGNVPDDAGAAEAGDRPPAWTVYCADGILGAASASAASSQDSAGVRARDTAARVLEVVQEWCADETRDERARLVVLTRGAVAAAAADGIADLPAAAAWGLVRAAQSEHPGRIVLLDLDAEDDSDLEADLDLGHVLAVLGDEPQSAVRGGWVLAARLIRADRSAEHQGPRWDPDGTVLITGGTGGIGAMVARHLVTVHGVRGLLLVSRSGPAAPGAQDLADELTRAGARVQVVAADVTDRASLAAALAAVTTDPELPLRGVVHTAGVIDDGMLETQNRTRLDAVMRVKTDALCHLHALTAGVPLTAFVAFSAAAGVFGSPGQSNYAAGNTFTDAFAAWRTAQGLPGLSMAWGLWGPESGMGARLSDVDLRRLLRTAVPLDETMGLALFDAACAAGRPLLVPSRLNLPGLRVQLAGGPVPPLLSVLIPQGRRRAAAEAVHESAAPAGGFAGVLAGLDGPGRTAALLELVRTHVSGVLGHDSAERIPADRPFTDLGFDSLTSVELRNNLARATGATLPATLVFDHPTPDALAAFLGERLGGGTARAVIVQAAAVADEPIAIVGMACRLPGEVSSPEQLWQLLAERRDGMSGFPADRGWPATEEFGPEWADQHRSEGGFIADASAFDAAFFGISPREARVMDPQQRILLETSWEALERAGFDPATLRGSQVGTFVGSNGQDYQSLLGQAPQESNGFLSTAVSGSLVSGRIAYALGLTGPALTVDTACSSSLVAMHLAAQALRNGECSMALAGGVTVMATPLLFAEFARQGGLAGDGRCKAYAGAADGTGWGEGVGVLVLETLSEARRNGHHVLGLLRGSAVNQDGASNGITAPNGPSQERVILQALANAGIGVADVDLVEGHGTGTKLGDPIEAQALMATYGQDRTDGPLWLGSVKSNLGHTQAAAGVAGVMKAILAMRHETMPATLHVDEPSPAVDWSAGAVSLLTEPQDWPRRSGRPRRAGVSSFGISGTNAHVIIEEGDPLPEADAERETPVLPVPVGGVAWPFSAKSEGGLHAQAARLAQWAADGDEGLVETGLALAARTAYAHRAAVVGVDRESLVAQLREIASGGSSSGSGSVAVLFSGQGSQRVGMGLGLRGVLPVFTEVFDEVCGLLGLSLGVFEDADALSRTEVTQPALFAVQVAAYRQLEAWGLSATWLGGHSIGELTAAHLAGVWDQPGACKIVAARGRLMGRARSGGAMAALEATEARVRADLTEGVGIAAVNGPTSIVVSGDADAVDALVESYKSSGRRARRLVVSHAFHSHHMDEVLGEFEEIVASVPASAPRLKLVSTLTGTELTDEATQASYWVRQVREAVRFADAVEFLTEQGAGVFLDVSPDGVLTSMVTNVVDDATAIPTLRKDIDEPAALLQAAARLFEAGADVAWQTVLGDGQTQVVLPPYAFERTRYWLDVAMGAGDVRAAGLGASDHPMLGACVRLPDGGSVLTGRLSLASHRWLADHVIGETVFVSGTGLVELAIRAGDEVGCTLLKELTLHAPLVIPAGGAVQVQVAVERRGEEDGEYEISIHSRLDSRPAAAASAEGGEWTLHASGVLSADQASSTAPAVAGLTGSATWPPEDAEPVSIDGLYPLIAERGYVYGPVYQGLRGVWRRDEELFVQVELPQGTDGAAFGVHPALLDSVLHGIAVSEWDTPGLVGLPFAWSGVRLWASGAGVLRARLTPVGEGGSGVRVLAVDGAGEPVIEIDRLVMRPLPQQAAAQEVAGADGARSVGSDLYCLEWVQTANLDEAATADADAAAYESWVVHRAGMLADGSTESSAAAYGGAGAAEAASARTLRVVQDWVRGEERDPQSRLVVLTRGAVAAGPAPTTMTTDLAAAAVWGLVRSAQVEHPGRIVLIDLDPADTDTDPAATSAALAAVFAAVGDEPQVAVRGGALYGARLVRAALPAEPTRWGGRDQEENGTVLITGGTGGLGALVARHLVAEHGVRSLVLLSRSGASGAGALELVGELAARGARVRVVAGDVTSREVLADAIDAVPERWPLRGVVHVAGVLDDGMVEGLTNARLGNVMRVKADTAWFLHELTADLPQLTRFVLFSSAAGTFGNAGQANYTAGNAFLDALAAWRLAQALPAVSVGWGLWEDGVGMGSRLSSTQVRRLAQAGTPISAAQGLAMFDAVTAPVAADGGPAHLLATNLDLAAIRGQSAGLPVLPLLRVLVPRSRRRAAGGGDGAAAGGALAQRLAGLSEREQLAELLAVVRAQAAVVLGHGSGDAVASEGAFTDLGFDSLTSVELRNGLARVTGLSLPATLVFDYPSPLAVAGFLRGRVAGVAGVSSVVVRAARAGTVDEPIAIVGMACRYPGGVRTADEFWDLIAQGGDGIAPFPTDRGWDLDAIFDPEAETVYAPEGGFVPDMAEFDAPFFGISPREALAMDPQQRLLLETTWEALEHAGIDPASIRGEQAGVFAGLMYHDYAARLPVLPESVMGFVDTGNAGSALSGRIAYVFGLTGPAMTVDTACSSSLVALHLAAQALRNGECSMALAGGVAVMSTPGTFAGFARQGGLAQNGRCKSFAGAADGTGWGEGVGMLVVERLSDARRLGHRVWGVVKGSAINQDGASNGLTAPNGPSQERVILQALANAGIGVADVDLIEGHGTGTTLGDPIEVQALLATYGQGREDDRPLWLGSVKSNIGHTQAAAGVAGVIKLVQALRHELMPQTLHVDKPSGQVDWTAGDVELLTEAREWSREDGRPRRAGVSSFGISGTNAHVIIEEGDPEPEATEPLPVPSGGVVWPLSAKSEGALRAQASRLAQWAADGDEGLVETGLALTGRSRFAHRAAAVGTDRESLVSQLREIAVGGGSTGSGTTAVLFSGQGSQRVEMGLGLRGVLPVFTEVFDEACELLDLSLGVFEDADALNRTEVTQPALFAVQVAAFRQLEAWGLSAVWLGGHSIGELTAAYLAGVWDLEGACKIVAARGRLMGQARSGGAMAALEATEAQVLEDLTEGVGIAAVNGPTSIVVSGDADAVDALVESYKASGRRARRLVVSHAFHSHHMDEVLAEFEEIVASVPASSPRLKLVSTLTGTQLSDEATQPSYWVRQVREAVRFGDAVSFLTEQGTSVYLDISPDGVLTSMVTNVVDGATVIPTLRKDIDEPTALTHTAAALHTAGQQIDWANVLGGTARPDIVNGLPTYAFDHARYWLEAPAGAVGDISAAGLTATGHPLLGAAVTLADGGRLLTGRLSLAAQPWLADHTVAGAVLLPATALLEFAVRAGAEAGCDTVRELTLHAPVVIPEDGALHLQITVAAPDADGVCELAVHTRPDADDEGQWTRHASGILAAAEDDTPDDASGAQFADLTAATWPPQGAEELTVAGLYERLEDGGVFYGLSSQVLRAAWRRGAEVFAEFEAPQQDQPAQAAPFAVDPVLLGGALQVLGLDGLPALTGVADDEAAANPAPLMPFSWTDVRLWSTGARSLRVRLAAGDDGGLAITAAGPAGEPVLTVRGLALRPLAADALGGDALRDALFELAWSSLDVPAPISVQGASGGWAVVGADPFGIAASTGCRAFTALDEVPADTPTVLVSCAEDDGAADGESEDVPARVRRGVTGVLEAVQNWLGADSAETAIVPQDARRLVVVTRGAVSTSATDPVADVVGAAAWGLVRSVQSEHPGRVLLLDLAPDASSGAIADALAAVPGAAAADEAQLAARAEGLFVPRLVRADAAPATPSAMPDLGPGWAQDDGTVLLTGATGGLGGVVARHLAASGVRELVLVSRSGWGSGAPAGLVAELAATGARVRLAACDVSQRAELAELVAGITASGRRLTGVVHLAGATADGVVESLTPAALDGALGAKVGGAWHLHELCAELDVPRFVVFSSAAGVMGGAGVAGYAAGNAFLDGLVSWRRARNLPGVSLAWGAWEEAGGMRGRLDDVDQRRLTRGGSALGNEEAVRLFDRALDADRPLLLPIRLDLPKMRADLAGAPAPQLLRTLIPAARNRRGARGALASGTEALIARLSALAAPQERRALLLGLVRTHAAAVLGHASAAAIPEDRAFSELGFDSLISVEMRNALAAATGLRLPTTLVFDYANPDALSGYLAERFAELMSGAGSAVAPRPRATAHGTASGSARHTEEPIAIVGLACRFPGGAGSAAAFWDLLAAGRTGLVDMPRDRGWDLESLLGGGGDGTAGGYASDTRQGCFLDGAAEFDAGFFGISPREALAMDPQQRLLLETSWEALESAGIDPATLRGGDAGVFVGTNGQDYGALLAVNPESAGGYVATGGASVMSGRVSYVLGLTGPAVTVDTACSSSLVAMHWAAQALRTGECSLALAGGVTVMATPGGFIEFSRQGGMAADGLCKSYAGSADGTGWGEGVGMLVVERLSDARRLGHQVWAVMRGSAVNQDGASNGLTAPNGPSQERVILQALANAGLDVADVDLVEGHGTGTRLGDPIEAQALLATYGQDREDGRPLWLGSVKSNIGHTQAAAGVAGVIKAVLAMRHELMPATLHVDEPSPQVDWTEGDVALLSESRSWPREEGRPRRAGVSSFGISGTNAHVIIEEGDAEPEVSAVSVPSGGVVWPLSAKSEGALRAQASRLAQWVADGDEGLVETGLALAGRSRFGHRAAAVGADRASLVAQLRDIASGNGGATVSGPLAVLFSGQGSQRVGMGLGLRGVLPVFTEVFDEACELLGLSLEVLSDADVLNRTEVTQPALFAVQVAAYRQLEAWGLSAAWLGGHSIGELTAAYLAGVWDLEGACKIVAARGRLMGQARSGGAMAALEATEAQVLEDLTEGVGIAAVNGPTSIVVSGDAEAVDALVEQYKNAGRRARRLVVSHAFHSHHMDEVLGEFEEIVASVPASSPRLKLVSTLTGTELTDEATQASYWVRQVREAVRFADAVEFLDEQGTSAYLDISPDGVLTSMVTNVASDATVIPTLRKDIDESTALTHTAAALHTAGQRIDWPSLLGGTARPGAVELPTYAFEHSRYWLEMRAATGDVRAAGLGGSDHPLLGAVLPLAGSGGRVLTGRLSVAAQPWLADHVIAGSVLVPGTAMVDLAIRAGDEVGCTLLKELTLHAPLVLPAEGARQLQITVSAPAEDGGCEIGIHTRPDEPGAAGERAEWTQHASGVLLGSATDVESARALDARYADFAAWPPEGARPVDIDGLYENLAAAGFGYGPTFRGLKKVWRRGDELFVEAALPEEAGDAQAAGFGVHPALLDAVIHALGAAEGWQDHLGAGGLPFTWGDVRLHASGARLLRARVSKAADGGIGLVAADGVGGPVVEVDRLVLRPLPEGALAASTQRPGTEENDPASDSLFTLGWVPAPESGDEAAAEPSADAWPELDDDADPAARISALEDAEGWILYRPTPVTPVENPDTDAEKATDPDADLATRVRAQTARALEVLRLFAVAENLQGARLAVVTRGAVAAEGVGAPSDLAGAAIWGLVRSAQPELPGRLVVIDLEDSAEKPDEDLARALAVADTTDEPQFVVRGGRVLLGRLGRASAAARLVPPADHAAWRLEPGPHGTLDGLRLVEYPDADPAAGAPLAPHEVRIEVRAAGLNFRDVLIALGMYPGRAELGSEGTGVVVEVGEDVRTLRVGDRVMGLFGSSFGPLARADHRMVAKVPGGWSDEIAASVPIVFLTAYYGLIDLGNVQAGETVLIHSAAGGVGMAAVQLARHLGARVLATASSGKWDAVRGLGVEPEAIASSRDLGFEDAFRRVTDGRGVDVVLNALAGDFIDATLRLMPRGGRLVEMGKLDLREPQGLAAAHPGVVYLPFDLMDAGPERIGEMLAELAGLFASGALRPLPVRSWHIGRAREAFQHVSQARHIGKVVLSLGSGWNPEGTVLISGGTGGIGARLARHLVTGHGVRSLLLLSRSGPESDSALRLTASLAELGAAAKVVACDVADPAAVAAALAQVPADRPLTAVVHAAGVVDDGVLGSLTAERVDRVMLPKADGAWNLHRATRGLPLDAFVLFSSAAGLLGSPGQANYAAGNAFLDGLAGWRRARGLPAVSCAWGLWAGAEGMGGRVAEGRSRSGEGLTADQGLALFDAAGTADEPVLLPMRMDLAGIEAGAAETGQVPPPLRALVVPGRIRRTARQAAQGPADGRPGWLADLPLRDPREQFDLLIDLVRTQAARVLRHASTDAVEPDRAFNEIGFDSLTAIELRNGIGAATGLRLPATVVFDHPTPRALAGFLLGELVGADGPAAAALLAELDRMESALGAVRATGAEAGQILVRLQALTMKWTALREERGAEAEEGQGLQEATDDELFAFIDRDLGLS